MDRNSMVRMKRKLNVTELSGEKVMVDFQTGKYFMIKGIGNDIWDMLGDEKIKVSEIIRRILEDYEVDEATCEEQVLEFLDHLQGLGILEVGAD